MNTHLGTTADAGALRSGRARTPRAASHRRRGITSLLAMLYLVVFAALALGFYAQTNMSVQVSNNERRLKEALMAAEAGVQYIRYELSRVTIVPLPHPFPPMQPDQIFDEIQMDLKRNLESPNGDNLAGEGLVGATVGEIDPGDGTTPPRFDIPADPKQYIKAGPNGPYFRVRIEQQGRDVVVTTTGKASGARSASVGARAGIEIRFALKEWPNTVFGYGLASKNAVYINTKNKVIGTPDKQASILSTYTGGTPINIGVTSGTSATSPAGIEGTITLMQGASNPTYVGSYNTVGGLTTPTAINNSIQRITEMPEWPTPDVTVFSTYAKTRYNGGTGTYDNIYIDPLYTPVVTFTGSHILRGVVLIKPGAKVTFAGSVNLKCVIVGEPGGLLATNLIAFEGTGSIKSPLSDLPKDEPQFAGLHELTGTFVLAPNWDVTFSGTFGAVAGSIAAEKITFTGAASAQITGSVVTLGNYPLVVGGSTTLTLTEPGLQRQPGLRFTERFAPVKSSYKEVRPQSEAVAAAPVGGT